MSTEYKEEKKHDELESVKEIKDRENNGGIEMIQDSIIIHLAKKERWNDLKTMLREHYQITHEGDTIICSTLIDKLLSLVSKNNSKQYKQIFNDLFDGLSDEELDILCEIYTKNILRDDGNSINSKQYNNKLLNHEKLPITLLEVYYYKMNRNKKQYKSTKLKEILEQIFDEFDPYQQKIDDILVRVLIPSNTAKNTKNDGIDQDEDELQQEIMLKVRNVNNNDTDKSKPAITKFGRAKKNLSSIIYEGDEKKSDPFQPEQFDELLSNGRFKLKNGIKVSVRSNAWLSCDLRLDEIKNKEQYFTISGWINVIWQEPQHSDLYKAIMKCYHYEVKSKNVWQYDDRVYMRILDLREADKISYYLPIDARKIFAQTTIKNICYRAPPYLIFNKNTRIVRTEYNITASLSEHFELFCFPFDKQFLNIKLRWNIDYYQILHWESGKAKNGIPKIPGIIDSERDREAFYDKPLKVNTVEELKHDIILHEPWIGVEAALTQRKSEVRYGLIRLRFTRSPMYHVLYILFPLFVIVLCGFSVYAISVEDVAERLGVSLTVLLTFTAFQSIVTDNLPNTAELAFLDYYIASAYLLQGLIIFSIVYPYFSGGKFNHNIELDHDETFAIILIAAWMIVSIVYIFGGMSVWLIYRCCGEEGKDFSLCDKLCWEPRGRKEIKQWMETKNMEHGFVMRLGNNTDNKTDNNHNGVD